MTLDWCLILSKYLWLSTYDSGNLALKIIFVRFWNIISMDSTCKDCLSNAVEYDFHWMAHIVWFVAATGLRGSALFYIIEDILSTSYIIANSFRTTFRTWCKIICSNKSACMYTNSLYKPSGELEWLDIILANVSWQLNGIYWYSLFRLRLTNKDY